MAKHKFHFARGNPLVKNVVSIGKKTIVKQPYFFVCAKLVGSWSIELIHFCARRCSETHNLGMHGAVVRRTFVFSWMNPLAGIGVAIVRNCSETQILSSRNCSAHCNGRVNLFECRSYIVFCNSGLRWSAYSYCVLQLRGCAGLRSLIVFWHLRVALVCVFCLFFVIQGCAGLCILIVFCISGLRWSAYSLLCFASQGCAGLRILIVFCNSGLYWSA